MTGAEAILWLALNCYREAASEPFLGKVAVGLVALNRAKECNESIKKTVLKPWQFSWTAQQHPAILNHLKPWQIRSFSRCVIASERAMKTYDFTEHSTYYHTVDILPKWAKDKKFTVRYGAHLFYSGPVDSCDKKKKITIRPTRKKRKMTAKDQARLAVQALKDKLHKEQAK